jgi:hypothetical protein
MAAHRDPQFLQEAKAIGIDVAPVGVDQMVERIEKMSLAHPEFFDYARKLFATGGGG